MPLEREGSDERCGAGPEPELLAVLLEGRHVDGAPHAGLLDLGGSKAASRRGRAGAAVDRAHDGRRSSQHDVRPREEHLTRGDRDDAHGTRAPSPTLDSITRRTPGTSRSCAWAVFASFVGTKTFT